MPIVLQINSAINYGSTGKIAEQIGLLVIQQGWDSYIAHGRYINSSESKSIQIGNKLDWIYHALMTRITDRHGLFSTYATKKLIKQIQKINPDVIHLHNIHGYYINYKILFKHLRKANIPIVWTLHDCWSMTGHCVYFDYAKCDRWQAQCYDCPQKNTYPTSLIFDRSKKNHIDKIQMFSSVEKLTLVPVSNWLAELIQKSFLNDKGVMVIRNGIDINVFNYCENKSLIEKYNLTRKRIILGVASPWSKRKGLNDFYKLYSLLPENQYQMVLIGLSSQQMLETPSGIVVLRRTDSAKELAQWYSISDVFVNLTYEDNYPTTNLEAISCGTPVVTYRTGGSPESVTPYTGRVVEQGDLNGVVSAVESLCAEDRDQLRKRCREYAVENFDKEQNYLAYLKLYEDILNKK